MILNRLYKGTSEGYQACAKEKNEHWLFHRIWLMETTASVVLYPERRHFILQLSWWISAKERWKPYILLLISLVLESYSKVVIHITYKFILLCLCLTYFKVSKIKILLVYISRYLYDYVMNSYTKNNCISTNLKYKIGSNIA